MGRFYVRVQPRARGNEIAGREGEAIKVRLTAPPVEGKANRALVDYLAGRLGVSKSAVAIVTGQGARNKLIDVEGLSEEEISRRLGLVP